MLECDSSSGVKPVVVGVGKLSLVSRVESTSEPALDGHPRLPIRLPRLLDFGLGGSIMQE